ncbi:MAG: FCD domain-containing protein [Spirochaetales bacterium]|nr:FCD domain-containing protein [Spirochaetales bacterium]
MLVLNTIGFNDIKAGGRALVLEETHNVKLLYKEHRKIFDAIKQNDPEEAGKAMTSHILNVKRIYKQNLKP